MYPKNPPSGYALPPLMITSAAALLVLYTPQHIGRLEAAGKFPKWVRFGPNRVAWLLFEVDAWLNERIAFRDASFDEQASF